VKTDLTMASRRTIADLLQLAADTIAPAPEGPATKLITKAPRWFEPGVVQGDYTPYFALDDFHWFPPGVVAGPFSPWGLLPGENVGVWPATLEEFAQRRVRALVFVRLCEMARAGEIRPLNYGLYPLEWLDRWGPGDIGHFELTPEDFEKICAAIPIPAPEDEAAAFVAPAATISPAPAALTTGNVAFCFDGLRWKEAEWRKPLGDKPKWLRACVVVNGQRGVKETRWNPVFIAAALVRDGHVTARNARARFQTRPLLLPWLEVWKTYEADNFNAE
jgi:hypothetical protein